MPAEPWARVVDASALGAVLSPDDEVQTVGLANKRSVQRMKGRFSERTVPSSSGRLLGIDYGSKRIGLAVSDPEGRVAVVLETFERKDDRGAARHVARVAAREGVGGLVLGEPRRLDGTRGDAARRVARFARRLEETTGLPVVLVDESLTSVEAERRLREAGVDPAADPGRVDAVAAQILLQEMLDGERL